MGAFKNLGTIGEVMAENNQNKISITAFARETEMGLISYFSMTAYFIGKDGKWKPSFKRPQAADSGKASPGVRDASNFRMNLAPAIAQIMTEFLSGKRDAVHTAGKNSYRDIMEGRLTYAPENNYGGQAAQPLPPPPRQAPASSGHKRPTPQDRPSYEAPILTGSVINLEEEDPF